MTTAVVVLHTSEVPAEGDGPEAEGAPQAGQCVVDGADHVSAIIWARVSWSMSMSRAPSPSSIQLQMPSKRGSE